jgi:hypothetical protein
LQDRHQTCKQNRGAYEFNSDSHATGQSFYTCIAAAHCPDSILSSPETCFSAAC